MAAEAPNYDIVSAVYLNPKCSFNKSYAIAKKPIEEGELICLDHCYYASGAEAGSFLAHALLFQPELFNEFQPQKGKWKKDWIDPSLQRPASVNGFAFEKMYRNTIPIDQGRMMGKNVSRFSPGPTPNAFAFAHTVPNQNAIPVELRFVRVIAARNIKAGQKIIVPDQANQSAVELIVTHDDGRAPDSILVSTTLPKTSVIDQTKGLASAEAKIQEYMQTPLFVEITVNQICNSLGLYRSPHFMITMERFLTYMGYTGPMVQDVFIGIVKLWMERMRGKIRSLTSPQ